jgi:hypothetical protein
MSETWYSICSMHWEYDKTCPRCRVGRWIDDEEMAADQALYKSDYSEWHRRANERGLVLEERNE